MENLVPAGITFTDGAVPRYTGRDNKEGLDPSNDINELFKTIPFNTQ
jgi:hypothetical protein